MQNEGTTDPEDKPGRHRARHLRLSRRPHSQRPRPLWQEPVRGALYAAGGSAITLLSPWVQHWLQR